MIELALNAVSLDKELGVGEASGASQCRDMFGQRNFGFFGLLSGGSECFAAKIVRIAHYTFTVAFRP